MGSRSATSEEGVSLPIGRRKHAGEACSIITGHDHLQRGHFAPSGPRKGTCPEWTPTPACLCLPLCGGSRRINYADKNAVTSRGTTSPATMPELPRSLSNIVDRSSSYKDNRKLPTFKRETNARDSKPTQDPKENVPKRHKIRSCSICLISNTFTDKEF